MIELVLALAIAVAGGLVAEGLWRLFDRHHRKG